MFDLAQALHPLSSYPYHSDPLLLLLLLPRVRRTPERRAQSSYSPKTSALTSFVTYDRKSRSVPPPTSLSPSNSVSVKHMANPSSSHQDRDRDRERERVIRERSVPAEIRNALASDVNFFSCSSHHHHRTISSTTLLLILSLVLAVLAVMLSLPSSRPGSSLNPLSGSRGGNDDSITNGAGLWGSFFNPRRSEALVAREHTVAKRESDVAIREADILAGVLATCNPIATVTEIVENIPPVQTIYKEVVHYSTENAVVPTPTPPILDANSSDLTRRIEDLIQRESKVADREKDMGRREEIVNRRENDASRREAWILEQLM